METYFTIIQYDSPADQVFLIKNTMHIYAYVENSADQSNAMIAEVNSSQQDMLLAKGYKLQTIESNPQIENYLYFYNETANQGNTLSQLGNVYVVGPNHTLIRYDATVVYDLYQAYPDFVILPLEDIHAQLALNNNVAMTPQEVGEQVTQEETVIQETSQSSINDTYHYMSSYIIIGGIILTVLLIIFALVYFRKTRAIDN